MDNPEEGEVVPYFEFTTVTMYKKVISMNDDSLKHRARVEYLDGGDCWITCSCAPYLSWGLSGEQAQALGIQQSFERHLAGGDPCST